MRVKTVLVAMVLTAVPVAAQTIVGGEALDFTLDSLDGGPVSLGDFRGQVVLINFFGYS